MQTLPWAITSISQPQFWGSIDLSQFGNGNVKGLISVDISDWTTPGDKTTTKAARLGLCQPRRNRE